MPHPGPETASSAPTELVIMVHGTGAAHHDDVGSAWWQRGSDFSGWLQRELGESVDCCPGGLVFHWSGANSEASRRDAAEELMAVLDDLERRQVRYHIIAHSHGGNVVWRAIYL